MHLRMSKIRLEHFLCSRTRVKVSQLVTMCSYCLFPVVEKSGTSCYHLVTRCMRPTDYSNKLFQQVWDRLHVTEKKYHFVSGCSLFATGYINDGSTITSCLCVSVKRQVLVYELNKTKTRHNKIKVRTFCTAVQRQSIFIYIF
jgi:hypothetical protein